MAKPKLRQLLEYVEASPGGISLPGMARELGISLGQVENMLDYWVRKGRLQVAEPSSACGNCSSNGSCPILIDSLRIYQINAEGIENSPENQIPCL